MYDARVELIADIYSSTTSDLNSVFDDFSAMHQEIKVQEATLAGEIETTVSFDEKAIDEIIRKAIRTGQQAGSLAFQLVKRLEYGLKLVKDRSGTGHFVITQDAVTDMEKYINDLVKRFYRSQLS